MENGLLWHFILENGVEKWKILFYAKEWGIAPGPRLDAHGSRRFSAKRKLDVGKIGGEGRGAEFT